MLLTNDLTTVAEDFVKVASGGSLVLAARRSRCSRRLRAPQPPLPRSGLINIYDTGAGGALVTKILIIQQK
jgi:hypothetical protein